MTRMATSWWSPSLVVRFPCPDESGRPPYKRRARSRGTSLDGPQVTNGPTGGFKQTRARRAWSAANSKIPPSATPRAAASAVEAVELGARRPAVGAGPSARLLPEREVADGHPAIDRLAHVVDRECGDRTCGHRLHLHAGAVDGVDLRLDLDVALFDLEVD